jgi:hypothetical protein
MGTGDESKLFSAQPANDSTVMVQFEKKIWSRRFVSGHAFRHAV